MSKEKKTSLVIMAAGMGSRYGGLKQLDPVGPNGELLIHYTVFDAARAGFDRVVFVIRKDFEAEFIERITPFVPETIQVAHAHQDLSDLPPERQKPWGTGHAVLVCKDVVDGPFGVVNADDYYGRNAVASLFSFLRSPDHTADTYGMIGYRLKNTVSRFGAVTRGVCSVNKGWLVDIRETGGIEVLDDRIVTTSDGTSTDLDPESTVSMNIWGFHPAIFRHLETLYGEFRAATGSDPKAEFLIPGVVGALIKSGTIRVKVIDTDDRWFGMTHRQDREIVKGEIVRMIEAKIYPTKLPG